MSNFKPTPEQAFDVRHELDRIIKETGVTFVSPAPAPPSSFRQRREEERLRRTSGNHIAIDYVNKIRP